MVAARMIPLEARVACGLLLDILPAHRLFRPPQFVGHIFPRGNYHWANRVATLFTNAVLTDENLAIAGLCAILKIPTLGLRPRLFQAIQPEATVRRDSLELRSMQCSAHHFCRFIWLNNHDHDLAIGCIRLLRVKVPGQFGQHGNHDWRNRDG